MACAAGATALSRRSRSPVYQLSAARGSTSRTGLPYIDASAAEDQRGVALIDRMAGGEVDVIGFTSSPQVRRLFEVAKSTQREEMLQTALSR
jgi:uroporphyrinogen-III synthase